MQIPAVGTTAKYGFTAPFAALNGIYRLDKVLTFDQALLDSISLVEHLYTPAGRTEDDYNSEWNDFVSDPVLMLVNQNDETAVVIYAPLAILEMIPDPMVRRYHDLYLAIDLGVIANVDDVGFLLAQVNDIAAAVTGTSASANLFSNKPVWMTEADYALIDTARASRIQAIKPVTISLRERDAEILRLRALIAHYEALLVANGGSTGP